jgi:hypothetical protein
VARTRFLLARAQLIREEERPARRVVRSGGILPITLRAFAWPGQARKPQGGGPQVVGFDRAPGGNPRPSESRPGARGQAIAQPSSGFEEPRASRRQGKGSGPRRHHQTQPKPGTEHRQTANSSANPTTNGGADGTRTYNLRL